jgi:DinB family protein
MRGTDVVGMLLKGSFALLEERLGAVRDGEWSPRVLPDTNKPGFVLWHCARILDWTVGSAIRGVPEVADSAPWKDRFPRYAGAGFGIPLAVADALTDATSAPEVSAYLAEVKASALEWFATQTDASLDAVPPLKAHQERHPLYLEREAWADIADLDGLPAWQLLLRPAGAHIRRHMGEYDLMVELLRSGAATPRA